MALVSPMNAANNVNRMGAVNRTNVYTLDKSGGLLAVQEQMVLKFVRELKNFDNLYYEICNEPYFGGVTLEWQQRISQVIVDEEKTLGVRHLISQNIANGQAKIENPNRNVSIFNFHYASPPDTVPINYAWNKAIGENETGFKGTNGNYLPDGSLGVSSSPAAAFTTTSITPSPPAMRTALMFSRPRNPVAAVRTSAARSVILGNSFISSISFTPSRIMKSWGANFLPECRPAPWQSSRTNAAFTSAPS